MGPHHGDLLVLHHPRSLAFSANADRNTYCAPSTRCKFEYVSKTSQNLRRYEGLDISIESYSLPSLRGARAEQKKKSRAPAAGASLAGAAQDTSSSVTGRAAALHLCLVRDLHLFSASNWI